MHWFPTDLKMLLNKMVSFGIARLVSSLNHLIMAIMKWFPFMFWHFEEYFWASDILRVLMTNENNYNIEMLIVLSTNLRTLCPRLIVCSTFYTFDNKPVTAMPKNNCRFEILHGKQHTWGCHAQECTICTETLFCFGTKWTKRPPEKDFERLYQGTIRTCYKKYMVS